MDYYTVVSGPGVFNYSVTYGNEIANYSAICEFGNFIYIKFVKNCVKLNAVCNNLEVNPVDFL
jgi:hypothetical protein